MWKTFSQLLLATTTAALYISFASGLLGQNKVTHSQQEIGQLDVRQIEWIEIKWQFNKMIWVSLERTV